VIRDRGVASRYANALFGAARQAGEVEQTLADLQSLADLHALDELHGRGHALQNFLEAPDVLTEHKTALLHRVLDGRVSDLAVRFLLLMLQKKRIQHLPLVLDHYRGLVEDHLGIVRAVVQTVTPLAPDERQALQQKLEALAGKKVSIETRIDPAIVGGIIVTLGGQVIDASLRSRLELLRTQLQATEVR